jgi:protein-L-isoaspartate(D-aspartate) O-methyltransferase
MIPLGTLGDPNARQHPAQRLPAWPWLAALLLAGAAVWLGAGRPNLAGRQAEDIDGAEALETPPADTKPERELTPAEAEREREWARQRERMVELDLRGRDIRNRRVLAAMGKTPRHAFVPSRVAHLAYADRALPIGHGQTISQPYIVTLMTQAADPQPEYKVLEVGTGSGYQAAVLAELVADVYTIELVPALAREASDRLKRLGFRNVHARSGDGYLGWPKEAPFDAILVTCGADHVPKPLWEQLKPGGRMVIPVGPPGRMWLRVLTKGADGEERSRDLTPVRFVPLRRPGDRPEK